METYEEIRCDRESGARRLVSEYSSKLMSAALMLTANAAEAEDLVFRTFERVILKIDDYRPVGSFYYWIHQIMLNFHRMDVRKAAARPKLVGVDSLPETPSDDDDDLSGRLDFSATATAVREAVRELPEKFREVVVLRYFEEMDLFDISIVTGLNVGTVKSRLHYAREALQAKLRDNEISERFVARLVDSTRRRTARKIAVAVGAALLGISALVAGAVAVSVGTRGHSRGTGCGYGGGSAPSMRQGGGLKVSRDGTEKAIRNGLEFLARTQKEDGSFSGSYGESAAIPALAGMAFLSKGFLPGTEPYGEAIDKAVDYVLACADLSPEARFRGYMGRRGDGRMYAHSIATLFLFEASGIVSPERQKRLDEVLPLAVKVIVDAQNQRKGGEHLGGWRYQPDSSDSDLSASGWALMALRSARLNGAQVPDEAVEKAVLYVKRSFCERSSCFSYQGSGGSNGETLTGAGILCLELCGKHLDEMSLKGAQYLRKTYANAIPRSSQKYYGLYYTSQGLFQTGGDAWREFSVWMHDNFIPAQQPDGSWRPDGGAQSPAYATSMTILALTVPCRMLPIYQRDETVDLDSEKEEK